MRQIDMSGEAVSARLKLVSQLRRLCLALGTARIRTQPISKGSNVKIAGPVPTDPEQRPK